MCQVMRCNSKTHTLTHTHLYVHICTLHTCTHVHVNPSLYRVSILVVEDRKFFFSQEFGDSYSFFSSGLLWVSPHFFFLCYLGGSVFYFSSLKDFQSMQSSQNLFPLSLKDFRKQAVIHNSFRILLTYENVVVILFFCLLC